jgi:transglutaminase-like putative cysteine protease
MTMWIDDEGRLLKGRMPLDMTVQRADKAEISREMRSMRELPDIISMTAVPVEGDLSKPDLKQVRLLIQGDKSLMIPDEPPRQTVSDYFVTLKASRLPAASFSLPAKDPKLEQFLGSSRFIRSDHPDIIKKAKEVVGNETDPVKAAGLINSFVHGYLNKTPTPGVPDAYGVLMNKQGDCNEHAVLAVSLARAVGLPSIMVVGLVHMDEGFAYHAWVNYWSGSEWFSGDPLLGTLPIGPLYISLVYGDVDKHVNVISFLGRLRVKVLEAS